MTEQLIIDKLQSSMARVGIVFNPLSGRNRKNTTCLRNQLTNIPGVLFQEVSELQDMDSSVGTLIRQGIDLLVIAGGDGMVQEVIKYLFTNNHHDEWPLLTIIPGGTTNMTASDLGIKGNPEKVIQSLGLLLQSTTVPRLIKRPALRIEHSGKAVNYGMFFGAGLIARGVKYSRSKIKNIGVTGALFSTVIALRGLAGFVFGRGKGAWQPVQLTTKWDGENEQSGTYLFVFASTLDSLVFGSKPYWGEELAPIHVTTIKQHRQFSWWSLLGILRGKGRELVESEVYCSKNSQTFEIILNDEYIIDGELYSTGGHLDKLRITATETLTFLIP